MKKLRFLSPLFILAVLFFLPACKSNKTSSTDKTFTETKITEIQPTTTSKEALASFQQGLAFSDVGDFKSARGAYTKAIEQDPKFAMAYLMRANTSPSAKEFANDLAKGKANLDSANNWEKMYGDYLSTNLTADRGKGIEIVEKIASTYPDAARAQTDLGNAYLGNNQFEKARAAYSKAIELNPNWVGGYNGLAASYLFNAPKDLKKAEENALKIVSIAPKSAGAQIVLGDVYRAQNNFQKAKEAYAKAVQLNPDEPTAYYKLGHANTFLGNLAEARKNYADGGTHDISKTGPVLNIAYTFLYAADAKAAEKYLMDQVSKLDASGTKEATANDRNTLLTTIGTIAIHSGDAATLKQVQPTIRETNDQVIKDLGNTEEIKAFAAADSLHWQAMIALAEGKIDDAKAKDEAMKAALNNIKDNRKLEGYYADMGMICMKQKDYKNAVSNFGKADQNAIYNKFMLAKANEAAGNKDKAMSLYKEVAMYNFNDVGNALARNEAKKKAATP